MARTWMDMHRLRRLHDSQYIMKNPFTNENSNLSNIFHNNIHRKKVESLKVRSTEEFLCQFAWLPCRFFRGRRQGRQPLNIYIYIYYININNLCYTQQTCVTPGCEGHSPPKGRPGCGLDGGPDGIVPQKNSPLLRASSHPSAGMIH